MNLFIVLWVPRKENLSSVLYYEEYQWVYSFLEKFKKSLSLFVSPLLRALLSHSILEIDF